MKRRLTLLIFLLQIAFAYEMPNTEKITLLLPEKDSFRIAGYVMAKTLGYYQEAGLDVQLAFESDYQKRTEKVLQSKGAYGVGSFTLVNEVLQKGNVVLIGSILQQTPQVLITHNLASIKSLRGKRIMIQSPEALVLLKILLKSENVSVDEITLLIDKDPFEAFKKGRVDAIMASKAIMRSRLKQSSINYTIIDPKAYDIEIYDDLIFTSNKNLNSKPKEVEAFYKATIRGWKYALSHMYKSASAIMALNDQQKSDPLALVVQADALKPLIIYPESYLGQVDFAKVKKMIAMYHLEDGQHVEINQLLYNKGQLKSEHILSKREQEQLSDKKSVKICINTNYLPFESLDDAGNYIGILADLSQALQSFIDVDFIPIPLVSHLEKQKALESGICEMYALHSQKKEYETALKTVPLLSTPMVFITQSKERFYSDFTQIIEKKIAVAKGDPIIEELKLRYPKINLIELADSASGLNSVSKGENYAFVGLLPVCSYYINKQGLSNLKVAGHLTLKIPIKFVVSGQSQYLVTILNKAIHTIDESKKNAIIKKWVDVDYKPGINYSYVLLITLAALGVIGLVSYVNYKLRMKIDDEVTKRRVQEQMLLQQSKMASIGEMIGNIAHQWRQPLMGLSALMMEIEAKIQTQGSISNESLHSIVERANKTMRFMSTTINDFWNFFSIDKEAVSFHPKEVIETTLNIMEATLKKSGVVIKLTAEENGEVFGYKNEFSQAVINIISNAKDILIERHIDNPYIEITISVKEDQCEIRFEDNGGGIYVEPKEKIFEPFVSERRIPSSGIGLCMTKNIIEKNMKGTIRVENSSTGACFTITVPLSQKR